MYVYNIYIYIYIYMYIYSNISNISIVKAVANLKKQKLKTYYKCKIYLSKINLEYAKTKSKYLYLF